MTILLYAIGLILLALLVIVFLASRKPDTFSISRRATIKASPERVYALIDRFSEWEKWSPWEKIDPNLQRSYSGAQAGVGAGYAWKGNGKVGEGRMEIIEARPASSISVRLDFEKPMKAQNLAVFTLTPRGDQTEVDWTMTGKSPLMSKIFDLLFSMEKVVGGDFVKGLAAMKAEAEKAAA